MLSTRDIRRQIQSIRGTAQITQAMQMVAASKMRKAQLAALAGRPFMHRLYRLQRKITTQSIDFSHPLLETREVRKSAVIVVAADKGLCGALNSNVFRLAAEFDAAATTFITAGRRATQFILRTGRKLAAEFAYADAPKFPEAKAIATCACDLFLKGEVDRVQVVATRFVNTLTQQAVAIEFLPIGKITGLPVEGMESESELMSHSTDYIFEPSPQIVLGFLLSHYLDIYLYQVLLNAKASEQSARMVSMKNATESANALIKDLTLDYNKLRQGNITNELLDIAGGQAGSA